jgi:hypothetical protein
MEEVTSFMSCLCKEEVRKLIGKKVHILKKDGTTVSGRFEKLSGNKLILKPANKGKVQTKAILPLVLFDLLAIGTAPYLYGGYGGYPAQVAPYGGIPYGGIPYGGIPGAPYGYPGIGY